METLITTLTIWIILLTLFLVSLITKYNRTVRKYDENFREAQAWLKHIHEHNTESSVTHNENTRQIINDIGILQTRIRGLENK